jgi:hypothetical protein
VWKGSVTCRVSKKGNLSEYANYRDILLNTAYKVLSNIIYVRLLPYTEAKIGSYERSFQTGRSTTDVLFIIQHFRKGVSK